MKTEHTPGPWTLSKEHKASFVNRVRGANNAFVAHVLSSENDARLIAAAPEMLEALKQLFDVLTVSGKHSYKAGSETGIAIEKARAIIAKAEAL